jgi:RHS repeat-associated protein
MVHLGSLADPPWIVLNLHTDHLGSVRVVTHTVTGAASRHDFFPFGEEVASEFSYNTHQYTGHERDSSSALHYMRARYFSDSVLRFLSPDRLSGDLTDPQGWNLYEYAGNSPMVFVDDTGWAKRIAVSSQYSLILSPGMRDSAGKVTEMPHGHFVKNSTGEGAGKIKINGEFEPGAARPPGKATIAAGLKAVIKRFGVAIVIAAVVDAEVAAGTVTYTSPIGDDPLIMWREYLEGMERLGYVVDWRFG